MFVTAGVVFASLTLQGLALHRVILWARLPEGERSSAEFAARLIDATGVVVTPGASYGSAGEGYIRISLTTPDDRLDEALRRLTAFAQQQPK